MYIYILNEIYIKHILYIMYILHTKKVYNMTKNQYIYMMLYVIFMSSHIYAKLIYIYIHTHYIHFCLKKMCIIRYRIYVMSILYLSMSHTLFTYNI